MSLESEGVFRVTISRIAGGWEAVAFREGPRTAAVAKARTLQGAVAELEEAFPTERRERRI